MLPGCVYVPYYCPVTVYICPVMLSLKNERLTVHGIRVFKNLRLFNPGAIKVRTIKVICRKTA